MFIISHFSLLRSPKILLDYFFQRLIYYLIINFRSPVHNVDWCGRYVVYSIVTRQVVSIGHYIQLQLSHSNRAVWRLKQLFGGWQEVIDAGCWPQPPDTSLSFDMGIVIAKNGRFVYYSCVLDTGHGCEWAVMIYQWAVRLRLDDWLCVRWLCELLCGSGGVPV